MVMSYSGRELNIPCQTTSICWRWSSGRLALCYCGWNISMPRMRTQCCLSLPRLSSRCMLIGCSSVWRYLL